MTEEQNERIEALETAVAEVHGTVRSAVRTAEVAIDQVLDINEKLEARLGSTLLDQNLALEAQLDQLEADVAALKGGAS